ncbi:MAG: peptidoglycan-binding domain-containing protein [Filomicrobium sp.]
MSERIIGGSLLVFGLFTMALVINLTVIQSGARKLAPAPMPLDLADARAPNGTTASGADSQLNQVVLLNGSEGDETTAEVQRELKALGYIVGDANGSIDLKTRAAIMAFEYDNGLPLTAKADANQLRRLLLGLGDQATKQAKHARRPATDDARRAMQAIQKTLSQLNYDPGQIDGGYSVETKRAIRNFELDRNLPETGRVSGRLIDAMAKMAKQKQIKLSRR